MHDTTTADTAESPRSVFVTRARRRPKARARASSLRGTLTVVTVVVVAAALLVSGALVGLTSALHLTTSAAVASVESIRLTQGAQIDLLLHARASDPLLQRDIEYRIRGKLAEMQRYAANTDEMRLIDEAEERLAAYVAARGQNTTQSDFPARQEAAYSALERLVEVNIAQARKARESARAWDRRADYIGVGSSISLLAAAAGMLLWLRRSAFTPLFSMAAVIDRFGKGDRDARLEENGPAELRDMGRRFNEMAEALAAQRRAQMAFLGGVAHDLRNPLSVLKMSIALMGADQPLPPEQNLRKMLQRIDRQVSRLERMTTDFLDIAKIEAGELALKLELHDVRQSVAHVVDLFEGVSQAHSLCTSIPDEEVKVLCDHVRIEQVLTNLISNAVKYSPAGSVIDVAVESDADHVVLRVTDRGIGIRDVDQLRVFDPFRRLGLSKEAVPGVGLGLFIVRRIIDAHGGRIGIESTLGAGSTFRIWLRRADRSRETRMASTRFALSRRRPATPS